MSVYHVHVFLLSILSESSIFDVCKQLLQSLAEKGIQIIIIL